MIHTHSCGMDVFIATNHIEQMYKLVFLDATKAFGRVEYVKLFPLLLKKGICPVITRLLLNMYINNRLTVVLGNNMSKLFRCRNGVNRLVYYCLFCLEFIWINCSYD